MNMRKIIAVLAAVLMLCSVVPFSVATVSAADGDVVLSLNFDDGNKKFDKGDIVAGGPDGSNCFKWTATGGWSATYMVVSGMDSSKSYTITMKAKGSVAGGMGTTIQNGDWGSYWNGPSFQVTTEWQDIVIEIPAGTYPFASGSILFKFQDTGVAMDLYVDDLVIAEGLPKKPLCENGDFETGDKTGWSGNSKLQIEAAAAYSGNYGAHLIGTGDWGGMMERTFDTEAGKNYELSFWIKANAVGTNIQIKQDTWQGANLTSGGYFSTTSWTYKTYTFTAASSKTYLNFCGANTGSIEDLYVDDVKLLEIKDPSFDGYIYNGDFETGKSDSWTNLWGSSTVEIVEGRDGGYALKGTGNGAYHIVYQEVNVTPNTNYTVWAYTKDASNSNLWIKNAGGNGDITNKAFASGEWALTSVSFNSGSNEKVWIGLMALAAGATYTVDDIFMFEAKEQSNDGYIKNGTFETGSVSPWDNLWGSCPTVEIVKGGKDDTFSLNLVSGQWKHFRQTGIAVEANTDYKISFWSKNVKNMNLLVKDNADTTNVVNKSIANSDDWALTEITFNTGAYTSILVSLMGGAEEAYGQFDNIAMVKLTPPHVCEFVGTVTLAPTCTEDGVMTYSCECGEGTYTETIPAAHTYEDDCAEYCSICEEGYRTAPHTLTYVEGYVPADCSEEGWDEYWFCAECRACYGNAEGTWQVNPAWLYYTGDCVRPEGSIPCAVVACTVCGNDVGGEACTRPDEAPVCQDVECIYCGEIVWGWGCNYNTGDEEIPAPLCQPGDCVYCGTHYEKLYDCENGSWAPCSYDGECAYGCGKQYLATGEHIFEDGITACDGGLCWLCWNEIEAADHVYDNEFDKTCNICGEANPDAEELYEGTGNSAMELDNGLGGLAFRFSLAIDGVAIAENRVTLADYSNATLGGNKVLKVGAIATNGVDSVDIEAKYITDLEADSIQFAVRIINIPVEQLDREIFVTPYITVEIGGEEVTFYGEEYVNTYNGAL